MIAGMAALVQAVQTNCDIADARHARDVSLCTYLLGMREFFRLVSMLVSIPVAFYSGWPFYQGAWHALRARSVSMDVPVTLGIVIAFVASVWNALAGHGEVYFDSVTMFVFFLSLGRYVEMVARHRAGSGQRQRTNLRQQIIIPAIQPVVGRDGQDGHRHLAQRTDQAAALEEGRIVAYPGRAHARRAVAHPRLDHLDIVRAHHLGEDIIYQRLPQGGRDDGHHVLHDHLGVIVPLPAPGGEPARLLGVVVEAHGLQAPALQCPPNLGQALFGVAGVFGGPYSQQGLGV